MVVADEESHSGNEVRMDDARSSNKDKFSRKTRKSSTTISADIERTSQPGSTQTLDTVEEESIAEVKQKTTVDRGVGSTPLPPDSHSATPLLSFDRKPYIPPFLPGSPLEQAAYQQSLAYYAQSAVSGMSSIGIQAPAQRLGQPLTTDTNEGRYIFNPAFYLQSQNPRMTGSPTHSDLTLLSSPPNMSAPGSLDRLAAQIHWDRYQRHLQQMQTSYNLGESSKKSMFSDLPVTPGSGSITLPPSLTSSRITSPRASNVGGKGRKRALSHSPLSEFLDIQSLTRSSEGSLHLTPLLHNSNSRSSSAASGSYGHLSAGSLASLTPTLKAAPSAASFYPPLSLPFHVPAFTSPIHTSTMLPASSAHDSAAAAAACGLHSQVKREPELGHLPRGVETVMADSSVVSSTMLAEGKESGKSLYGNAGEASRYEPEEAQEFKETVCKWLGCNKEYEQHDDLVKHVNQDHVGANKKSFVCHWAECCRQEKPFKAQYMLVVHMRRHTGEKPHKCHGFPGCNKAYSRLENLKTHMRSHTGEKPYMCEFPGCQKAFSNASDRAKHQNRTHSNAKPYACEIGGCSKRYTDPSSLRKHVKTVHGAEFYARKKHKGLDTPSCRSSSAAAGTSDKKDDDSKMKDDDCISATGMSGVSRQVSQESVIVTDQGSPQSDTDVEINVLKADRIDIIAAAAAGMGSVLNTVAEVDDEVEAADQEVPDGGLLVRQPLRNNRTQSLKQKLAAKTNQTSGLATLPNVPKVVRKKASAKDSCMISAQPNQYTSSKHCHLPEIIENIPGSNQYINGPRRDSNTSTLSSYMSSLRSDASPAIFNSRFSSRRSSEVSQNSARFSIINSPYEYDMMGNIPEHHMKELNSVTEQMERARLGSHPNLYVQSQAISGVSPSARRESYRAESMEPMRRRQREGWHTTTPSHTPLPHEYPQYERRRASDPVRCTDPNFSELKKLQHRYYSLNTMKPLPIPVSMKSLSARRPSQETFYSSHSSIATNHIHPNIDYERSLDMQMMEDNEQVVLPDDMRQFLLQHCAEHTSSASHHLQHNNNSNSSSNSNVEEWVKQTNSHNHHNIMQHQNHVSFRHEPRDLYDYPSDFEAPLMQYQHQSHYQQQTDPYHHIQQNQCRSAKDPEIPFSQHTVLAPHNVYGIPSCDCEPYGYQHNRNQGYQTHSNMCLTTQNTCHQPDNQCQNNHMSNQRHPEASPHTRVPYNNCHSSTVSYMPVNTTNSLHPNQNNGTISNGRNEIIIRKTTPRYKTVRPTLTLSQSQLSPPCEVSSSTDLNPSAGGGSQPPSQRHDIMNGYDYLLADNLSTISAELHSLTSQNISSVSQLKTPVDNGSNMVINNMSNALSHYTEESRFLQQDL